MLARSTSASCHCKSLHQALSSHSRVVISCTAATIAELASEPAFATPVVPSKRPVRSRRLHPDLTDPEDISQYILFYPPWCLPSQQSNDVLGSGGQDEDVQLPVAYSNAVPSSITHDIEEQTVAGDASTYSQITTSGGYLAEGNAREAAHHLIASARQHTVREMLGLGFAYEDDFFRGPDYRYSVDDQGRILDMVHVKRQRIPAPYQRAVTSIPSAAAGTPDGFGSMAQTTSNKQAGQHGHLPEYSDEDVQQDDGQYEFLGPAMAPTNPGRRNISQKHATSIKARQAPTHQPSTSDDMDLQQSNTPQSSGLSIGMLLDIRSVLESQQSSVEVEETSVELTRFELSDKSDVAQEEKDSSRHHHETKMHNRDVKPKSGGQFLSSGEVPSVESQGTVGQSDLPVLRAYVYCIGSKELFQGLWDLDLLDKLLFTDKLDEADLILHKRPQPGEKQFAFNRLRDSAKERGIPFVSVRDGSVQELQDYLMPIYKLYMGQLSPQSLIRQYGPKAGGKHQRRIRL